MISGSFIPINDGFINRRIRAEEAWCLDLSGETRIKDEPRFKEPVLSSALPKESTMDVCKAVDALLVLERGRSTRLLSSKLSPLCLKFSSVLGLTVSAPTTTG